MRGLVAVLGIGCLLAIAFTREAKADGLVSVDASGVGDALGGAVDAVKGIAGSVVGSLGGLTGGLNLGGLTSLASGNNSAAGQLGKALANETVELVKHLVTCLGIVVASVQQIFDGLCETLFNLYDGFLYPILDCIFSIMGLSDAICAISSDYCIAGVLQQMASGNASETTGLEPQQPTGRVDVQIGSAQGGEGGERRRIKREEGEEAEEATEAPRTQVIEESGIAKFMGKFSGEDRKFAGYTLRLIALILQVTTSASVQLHLQPIILCVDLRISLGFNELSTACKAVAAVPSGGSGGPQGAGEPQGSEAPAVAAAP